MTHFCGPVIYCDSAHISCESHKLRCCTEFLYFIRYCASNIIQWAQWSNFSMKLRLFLRVFLQMKYLSRLSLKHDTNTNLLNQTKQKQNKKKTHNWSAENLLLWIKINLIGCWRVWECVLNSRADRKQLRMHSIA